MELCYFQVVRDYRAVKLIIMTIQELNIKIDFLVQVGIMKFLKKITEADINPCQKANIENLAKIRKELLEEEAD